MAMTHPAGWYPSPDGMPVERFWDGMQWTPHQRATSAGSAPFGVPSVGQGAQTALPPVAPFRAAVDVNPIEKGTNRWLVGAAMLVVSMALALSSFFDWAHLTYAAADGHGGAMKVSAELSGFGAVTVDVPGIMDSDERRFVESKEAAALEAEGPRVPGISVLTVGTLMAVAAWAYMKNRHRFRAALAIIAIAVLGVINGIWRLTNVRGMFNDPVGWSQANYSAGFGLIAATATAFLLVALGVSAIILEQSSSNSATAVR